MDSTHSQHNPVISYGWIKKGEEFKILTHNSSRYYLNITKNSSTEVIRLIMDNVVYNRVAKVVVSQRLCPIVIFV